MRHVGSRFGRGLMVTVTLVTTVALGVVPADAGLNVWTTTGPDGGPVYTIALHPTDPQTMIAGTFAGGIWKTSDGGAHWSLVDALGSGATSFGATYDPTDGSIIYAGGFGGVEKSTDGGATWAFKGSGHGIATVRSVRVDPSNHLVVYSGTDSGIFKTTNGGDSWSPANSGLTNTGVRALAIDPSNTATLYAGTAAGVFKTTTAGGSWNPTNSGLTNTDVKGLVVDPSSPQTLYAATLAGVFKSVNGATSWTPMNTGLTAPSFAIAIANSSPQSLYTGNDSTLFRTTNGAGSWSGASIVSLADGLNTLAVNPANAQIVYAGTGGGVLRSSDGGATWGLVTTGILASAHSVTVDTGDPDIVYAAASGAGLFKSTDGGQTWVRSVTGMTNLFTMSTAIDPTNHQIVYAAGKTMFKSLDGGSTWALSAGGLPSVSASNFIRSVVVDPGAPQMVYAATHNGPYRSTDGGANWTAAKMGFTGLDFDLDMDPTNPQVLYSVGSSGVFKSTNGASSWTPMNTGLSNVYSYEIELDPTDPQTLFLANTSGVFRSTDGGASWTELAAYPGASATAIGVDRAHHLTMYAGSTGGAARTFDGGATWETVGAGFPGGFFNGVTVDPAGATVYASTQAGVRELTLGFAVTVTKAGTGAGTVTSTPDGIDCGATCSADFVAGQSVQLTATPAAGSIFTGWSGDCSGTGGCAVNADEDRAVTATFDAVVHRPDGRIKLGSKRVGDDVYSKDAKNEARTGTRKPHSTAMFTIEAQNDGNAVDSFQLKGPGGRPGVGVQYFVGTSNVTSSMTKGLLVAHNIPPGGMLSIKLVLTVKKGAAAGTRSWLVTISTTAGPALKDAVKAVLKVVP